MVEIKVADQITVKEESYYEICPGQEQPIPLFQTLASHMDEIQVIWGNDPEAKIVCLSRSSVISQLATKLPQESPEGRHVINCCRTIIEKLRNILF